MPGEQQLDKAAEKIRKSNFTAAFTGSGISVESGIPPFRGKDGIWSKYDPKSLELGFFFEYPKQSWRVIKEIFYNYFGAARSNRAHFVLAEMEQRGLLQCVITQNIDNLHQQAGSKTVYEFHGNSNKMLCTSCYTLFDVHEIDMNVLPPSCLSCNGLLKPDFIFFGEGIPQDAFRNSLDAAGKADVMIVVGTTGEVMPAAQMPYVTKQKGGTIIEVNTEISRLTHTVTDIFLEGKASEVLDKLAERLFADQEQTSQP